MFYKITYNVHYRIDQKLLFHIYCTIYLYYYSFDTKHREISVDKLNKINLQI